MDRAWLVGTLEEPLEPEMEIVDAHHHLWADQRRGYDLKDLRLDTESGHRVVQTVFVDCMTSYRTSAPEHLQPVGETEWVAQRADESTRTPGAHIAAIVGHASLSLGEAVEEVLAAHVTAGRGLFRGVRDAGAWDADERIPSYFTNPAPGLYGLPSFRAGVGVLARMGLTFDAWQYHPQLPEVAELARACPEATIVLNHIGAPLGTGPYADRRAEVLGMWRAGLAELATCSNILVKIGGIGMARFGAGFEEWERPPTSDELLRVWGDELRWCIDLFGPDRCMFESNFPVDAESCSYVVLWNAFKKLSASYTTEERTELFAGTARRVYRIAPPSTTPSASA